MAGLSYGKAGVDIGKGDSFASFIGRFPSRAVSKSIGGFSGGVPFDPALYTKPILLSTTDGVGTKLLVARKLATYDTIGIDLVAMSVNDLIVCGAVPMAFLDYIACGRLNESVLQEIITGVIRGCEQAECTLTGGETAEMPDVYGAEDFDLAGFCVGIVEESEMLPHGDRMRSGDAILALPSSGIHSNGLSLARRAVREDDLATWREMLTPTRIYVKEMKTLSSTGRVLGAAHITGGGLEGNFARIVPAGLRARFSWSWTVPEVFERIRTSGRIETAEMRRVFNMGVGIALVVHREDAAELLREAKRQQIELIEIGELVSG
ncbi:phosphoribosylformylglycinamidine cyclo-ligase [Salinispira pacifica]